MSSEEAFRWMRAAFVLIFAIVCFYLLTQLYAVPMQPTDLLIVVGVTFALYLLILSWRAAYLSGRKGR